MLTPRENFVRFLKKENYEWIPSSADMLRIMPAAIPGFVARGLVFQQNPYTGQFGGKDLFGVDLAPTGSMPLSDEDGRTMLSKIFEQYKGKNVWYGFTRQFGPQLTKLATELLKTERKEP